MKVKIYPNGVDKDGRYTAEVWLMFNSVEERDQYVNDELRYCRKEEEALLNAFFRNDRIRCKNNLLLKRVEFAKNQGFQKQTANTWIRRGVAA
jgi:hypothetical protein